MTSNTLAKVTTTAGVSELWTPEQIELLKRQIAPADATDDEIAVFLMQAKKWKLDPFSREIWLIRRKSGEIAKPEISRDGLLAIAERSGQFDGLVSGVVKDGDRFIYGITAPDHEFGEERGRLRGAYAYAFRKDKKYPSRYFAEWGEHGAPMTRDKDGQLINQWSPWSKFPSLMILKSAERNALNRAFRPTGLLIEGDPDEEDSWDIEQPATTTVELPPDDAEIPVFDEDVPEGQLSVEEVLDPEDAA